MDAALTKMAPENLSVHLAVRPKDDIVPGETFKYETTPTPKPADLKDGQILVESLYLALEPSMRVWLSGEYNSCHFKTNR